MHYYILVLKGKRGSYTGLDISVRTLGKCLKARKETSNEELIVLGSRDKQWSVLEKVTVRNQQNGLASFELTENFDRFVTSCFNI